jgi:hypothetical protein
VEHPITIQWPVHGGPATGGTRHLIEKNPRTASLFKQTSKPPHRWQIRAGEGGLNTARRHQPPRTVRRPRSNPMPPAGPQRRASVVPPASRIFCYRIGLFQKVSKWVQRWAHLPPVISMDPKGGALASWARHTALEGPSRPARANPGRLLLEGGLVALGDSGRGIPCSARTPI